MKVSEVLDRVSYILQDDSKTYWSQVELMRWLNDGRSDACKLRPDLYESTETLPLVAGFRQTLPNNSRQLFDVTRNVSSAKMRQITLIDDKALARVRPNWRSGTPSAEIQHYLYDPRRAEQFDIFPPASAGVTVEISYAKPPTPIADGALTTDLVEEGEFASALVDYVCYRAFLKESDTNPQSGQRASNHLQLFTQTLQAELQSKAMTSPEANRQTEKATS